LLPNPLIQKIERFGPLTEEEQSVLADAPSRVVHYEPRQDIVAQGSCPSESSLILKGYAHRYKHLDDGRRQITAFHVPGDFADLHSFLLKKMDDGVTAITPCKVALVPHKTLREITKNYPYLTRVFWMTTLIDGAVHREWMTGLGRMDARERIAHLLCEMHTRLKTIHFVKDRSFDLPMTQAELGDAFGLTTVHTNRVLQELRGEGLITLKGKTLTILDWDRLRQEAKFNPDYLHVDQQIERD
jgi:CRP-like cAMP-binding protein